MNTRPLATGVTLLSGAGGSARTSTAVGLAARLARKGHKTLFFDFCFGWSGLNIGNSDLYPYERLLQAENCHQFVTATDYGFDLISCLPPNVLNPDSDELQRITYLVHELGGRYDFIILDPPASAHPLSLLAAGLCEEIFLLIRPDAAAVASSYCLLKNLVGEGLNDRIKIAFAFVDSPEQAASLKSKFDQLTGQFIKTRFPDGGFVYRIDEAGDGGFRPEEDIEIYISNAKNLILSDSGAFHHATIGKGDLYQIPA